MRKSESNHHESNNEDLSNYDISSSGSSSSSTITTPLPQILTRNSYIPSLNNLDAGDVVECYALMRTAKLENGLLVRKTALAFRYIHKSSSTDSVEKAPFELTLEYGPQRTGSTQSFESMPSINGHDLDADGNGKYVAWENHAKIYYSLSISAQDWRNAYYMAPITGAVLSKVLSDYILDYTEEHPRYQPFTVIDQASGKVVLKSSNSEDFVWNVFTTLSNMYVSIKPILAPRRYAMELHVEDVKRDVRRLEAHVLLEDVEEGFQDSSDRTSNTNTRGGKQNVANAAADFYSKLFSCIEAIKTGDYSQYRITPSPSPSPSRAPSVQPSHSPSSSPTVTNAPTILWNSTTFNNDSIQGEFENQMETQDANSTSFNTLYNGGDRRSMRVPDHGSLRYDRQRGSVNQFLENTKRKQEETPPTTKTTTTETENNNVLPFVDDANEAAEAAEKAAQAAKEAAESNKENEAMVAASQAVEAAKKAAVATSKAAAETASESLLSGDGNLMVNVLNQCFSDPKYGIRRDIKKQENRTQAITDVFIYVDGSHYYKLNLTTPYLKISEFSNAIPGAVAVPNGKSDIIDIGLALIIFLGLLFGFVVMLHQIKVIDWDQRLHFRWFFKPDPDSIMKKGEYSNAPLEDVDDLHLNQEESGDFELSQPVSTAKFYSGLSSNIDDLHVTEEGRGHCDFSEPVIFSSPNKRSNVNNHF